jgi:hypothetical protein
MTKAELVAAMAKASGESKVSAERALNAFLDGVFDSLKKGRRLAPSWSAAGRRAMAVTPARAR